MSPHPWRREDADGYELLVADCATAGLSLLERKVPAPALVDLGLPDSSGPELLRRVRTSDGVASRSRTLEVT